MENDSLYDFQNWKNQSCKKSAIPANWSDEDLEFDWVLTVQTDEVPESDPWESFTTEQKEKLKHLHSLWGIPNSSTEHFMSFSPILNGSLAGILNQYQHKEFSHNALKLDPGHMLVWHFDTYATFVNRKNISIDQMLNVKRSAIMLTDWTLGQIIQIGNDMIYKWKKGDVFTWDCYTWHGTANFGNSTMIVLQVSYLEDVE